MLWPRRPGRCSGSLEVTPLRSYNCVVLAHPGTIKPRRYKGLGTGTRTSASAGAQGPAGRTVFASLRIWTAMERIPMTADGYKALEHEVNELKAVERPAIIKMIAEARAH